LQIRKEYEGEILPFQFSGCIHVKNSQNVWSHREENCRKHITVQNNETYCYNAYSVKFIIEMRQLSRDGYVIHMKKQLVYWTKEINVMLQCGLHIISLCRGKCSELSFWCQIVSV
jgi:hypothetical protein